MRRNASEVGAFTALISMILTSLASAQVARADAGGRPAAKEPAPPRIDPDGRKMTNLLQKWERQSTLLKSLDVHIARVDEDRVWNDKESFEGRALFKSPNLVWLEFDKIMQAANQQPKKVHAERIVCTGTSVWHYKYDTQQIFVYELDQQARQRALQQGPLPFLFNFRVNQAKERYSMELLSEDATAHLIALTPLLNVDKDCFSKAYIELERQFLLPRRIVLVKNGGNVRQDFQISEIQPNKRIMDENFKGKPAPGWKIHFEESGAPARPAR
jgi:TIGR03009 family protein